MSSPDVAVVLVEPREAGNIGAAARAMANMGLRRLILVNPAPHLVPEAFRMALGGREILEGAELARDLAGALDGFGFVAGTTRRQGKARSGRVSPRDLGAEMAGLWDRNPCAVVFGREDKGLTNLELELCHRLVTIPSSPRFESLNLAQSVLVVAYEILLASRQGEGPSPGRKLAPLARLEELYTHAERVLLDIGYLDRSNPRRMMRVFRRIFARAGLDEREVRALRGVFRQVDWYCRRRFRGRDAGGGAPVDRGE